MIAFITGATSGIGKATAIEFAKHGYNLIITGRREERLLELKYLLEKEYHVEILSLCFDVRDEQQVQTAIDLMPVKFKKIDNPNRIFR